CSSDLSLMFELSVPPLEGITFGSSVAVGQMTADARREIAVGRIYGKNVNGVYVNALFVFSGWGSLLGQIDAPAGHGKFGWSLACADVSGDGLDDILVCDPESRNSAGVSE